MFGQKGTKLLLIDYPIEYIGYEKLFENRAVRYPAQRPIKCQYGHIVNFVSLLRKGAHQLTATQKLTKECYTFYPEQRIFHKRLIHPRRAICVA